MHCSCIDKCSVEKCKTVSCIDFGIEHDARIMQEISVSLASARKVQGLFCKNMQELDLEKIKCKKYARKNQESDTVPLLIFLS